MKKKNFIALVGVCAVVGAVGYYGLTRKEIADRVIVKLAGMPRIHGFKNGELLMALDVTVTNPSESGFTMSRPFVMVEVLDWLDKPAIINTEPSGETITVEKLSTKKIENIMIGLPVLS